MIQPMATSEQATRRIPSDYYVEGYATTFDTPYPLFEKDGITYFEQIDRGALVGIDLSDVIMQYDHSGKVLARRSNGSLIVEADMRGLFVCADLSKSSAAKDMYEEINNGLVTRMSWGFLLPLKEDIRFDRETRTATIMRVRKVFDVSAVSIPANAETEIAARSFLGGVIEAEKQERLARRARILLLRTKLEVLR